MLLREVPHAAIHFPVAATSQLTATASITLATRCSSDVAVTPNCALPSRQYNSLWRQLHHMMRLPCDRGQLIIALVAWAEVDG